MSYPHISRSEVKGGTTSLIAYNQIFPQLGDLHPVIFILIVLKYTQYDEASTSPLLDVRGELFPQARLICKQSDVVATKLTCTEPASTYSNMPTWSSAKDWWCLYSAYSFASLSDGSYTVFTAHPKLNGVRITTPILKHWLAEHPSTLFTKSIHTARSTGSARLIGNRVISFDFLARWPLRSGQRFLLVALQVLGMAFNII
jgi:hypothetical protein